MENIDLRIQRSKEEIKKDFLDKLESLSVSDGVRALVEMMFEQMYIKGCYDAVKDADLFGLNKKIKK